MTEPGVVRRQPAPAKINLHLRVAPLAADGYHPLASWMVTVGLFDTLTVSSAPDRRDVTLTCDDPTLPCDGGNLVLRAADALRRAAGRPADDLTGVAIHLAKRIPSGGGLGGGSSDAATTLLALNEIWRLDLSREQLRQVAAGVGSDVAFFLFAPSAACTGRGEIVRPIAPPTAKWAVLILPGLNVSTPAVYRMLDAMNAGQADAVASPPDWSDWCDVSTDALLSRLVNDLERPAFAVCPELADLRVRAERVVARPVRMSGSGSTLFTLYDDAAEAAAASERLSQLLGVRAIAAAVAPTNESS